MNTSVSIRMLKKSILELFQLAYSRRMSVKRFILRRKMAAHPCAARRLLKNRLFQQPAMVVKRIHIVGLLILFCVAAQTNAAPVPACEQCTICNDEINIALADNDFMRTIHHLTLLACPGEDCEQLVIDDFIDAMPIGAGDRASFSLGFTPRSVFIGLKLDFCDNDDCDPNALNSVTTSIRNCRDVLEQTESSIN